MKLQDLSLTEKAHMEAKEKQALIELRSSLTDAVFSWTRKWLPSGRGFIVNDKINAAIEILTQELKDEEFLNDLQWKIVAEFTNDQLNMHKIFKAKESKEKK